MDVDYTPPAPGALTHPLGDVDWVALGMVTPVKNGSQTFGNSCPLGSIFSAVPAYESLMWINGSTNGTTFSERQVYDCISANPCSTSPQAVWNFINSSGIVTQASYPWRTNSTRHCNATSSPTNMWYNSALTNCSWMQTALQTGPIAAYTYNGNTGFMTYSNGTFTCSGNNSGYVVWLTIVGYTNSTWTGKNSWGTGWG